MYVHIYTHVYVDYIHICVWEKYIRSAIGALRICGHDAALFEGGRRGSINDL